MSTHENLNNSTNSKSVATNKDDNRMHFIFIKYLYYIYCTIILTYI